VERLSSPLHDASGRREERWASEAGRNLGPGAAFRLNLPNPYGLAKAEKRLGAKVRAEVEAA
jgi:hypothetical protein